MEINKYKKIVNKNKGNTNKFKNIIISFFMGGLIGILGQFLTELYSRFFSISTKDAASFSLVTIIFIASLLTALGVFDKLVDKFKCGLIIPITGFAHSMMSSALEYKKDGLIYGLGSNVFKLAGTVIYYGVVAAWIFGLIRIMIGG